MTGAEAASPNGGCSTNACGDTTFRTAEEAVGWLVAMQAQEFPVAKWSVAQRTSRRRPTPPSIGSFADGGILRTHILRPTWHFVLPADLRWLLALSAPRVHALNALYYRRTELDDKLFAGSEAVLRASVGRDCISPARSSPSSSNAPA